VFHSYHRPIMDAMASAICHGLFDRFPSLRFLPVENGSRWVAPLLETLAHVYGMNPHLFGQEPVQAFKRNIWVHPFHEDDPLDIIRLIGADRVVFGSDYPHPEGLAEPTSYIERLAGLSQEEIARVMGGNMAEILRLAA
jgi:predicted TIM-barrel fold metal-dependent hydrolase